MPQLQRQTGTSLSDINIVPFVDVMLVLLVIFMITAPVLQSGIEVSLPKTKTVRDTPNARVIVTIDRSQRLYLGDEAINIHDLGSRVLAQAPDAAHTHVYVRCDETVPYGTLAMVIDTLRQSGIQNVDLITQPLSERPQSR
ncbi:MAG: ExbD/TolR family protein [Candidatus Acidiferrales bacterium]